MTFDQIVPHLGQRGFVTRTKWLKRHLYVYFGMDNVFIRVRRLEGPPDEYDKDYFVMCLDDILATDWQIVPLFWKSGSDHLLPFQSQ